MYIWNADKVYLRGRAKIRVNFYEPDLIKIIGISRLVRNVRLINCWTRRGFLWVEVENQRKEVKTIEFSPEEVMEVIQKRYNKK